MKLNKLSVRELLLLGFMAILGFNLLGMGISLINFNSFQSALKATSQESSQIRELSLEIQTEFLLARQDESAFLANWRLLGFDNARKEYGEQIQFHLDAARTHLNELQTLSINSKNKNFREIANSTVQLSALLGDYENSFNATLGKIQTRIGANGLEKSLASGIEEMQFETRGLDNQFFFDTLIQIQKNEQGYFSTYRQEYIDYVRINTIELVDLTQATEEGGLETLNAEQLSTNLLEHYDTFTKIVALDQDIIKNTTIFRDITIDINLITKTIGEVSRNGLILANQELDSTYRTTLLIQLTAGSLSLLSVIGVFIILARQTLRPLNQLTLAAERLGQGDFEKNLDIHGLKEFSTLSQTFNSMSAQLSDLIESLEQHVAERTRDLQMATDVSRQITQELKLEKLLPNLVKQTREGFDLYSTSIFLYQPETDELQLEADDVKENGVKTEPKSFHINTRPSLTAEVARTRKTEVLNNIDQSSFVPTLRLPSIKSHAAFPMIVGDDLVGVLDLQAETIGRFKDNDIRIFSTLAEQIAIAVRNAQLYRNQEKVTEELKRTDIMKSQFLASMSHELRTPMNAIINLIDLVASEMVGPINTEQQAFLNQSLRSSHHLLHLINDVLDISKIQAGQLTLNLEQDVNIYEEIDTALKMSTPLIKESVEIIQDIDSDIPLIEADRRRIRQVLLNLLSNAAKFTDKGSITLILKKRADYLLFAVADTGPGIPFTAQTIIFEPFTQTEDGRKRVEGTGLGLPISKNLVEAHGGKLWVESQPNEGSVFYFSLPYPQIPTYPILSQR